MAPADIITSAQDEEERRTNSILQIAFGIGQDVDIDVTSILRPRRSALRPAEHHDGDHALHGEPTSVHRCKALFLMGKGMYTGSWMDIPIMNWPVQRKEWWDLLPVFSDVEE